MKKSILVLLALIVSFTCVVPSSEAFVGVIEGDKSSWLQELMQSIQQNEMIKQVFSAVGISSVESSKNWTEKIKEMTDTITKSQNERLALAEKAGELFEEIEKAMSELEFSQKTRDAASKQAFSEMAKFVAEDVLKKIMNQGAFTASAGTSGPVFGAASSGSSPSGETDGSSELSEQAKELLGKHYPYSLPQVLMKTMQEIFRKSSNFEDAARGSRAIGEEARILVQEYGIELLGKYIADKDKGKNHYEKIAEEVSKTEEEITKEVEKDSKKFGGEQLDVLKLIATYNAAMVKRQMNTNILLVAQIQQANDRAKMLSHNTAMLAESYGQSLERWMRVHAREQYREDGKRK